MKLASLLASLPENELDRLAVEHVRSDDKLARPQLCNFLEGAIRSHRFIHDFVFNRQPPTFALLSALLDAPGYELPRDDLATRTFSETLKICSMLDSGELLARGEQFRLYRRALYESRRNDLQLVTSETSILSVLRQELGMTQVEHFLIEHHQDLREFWDKPNCYEHEERALRSAGVIFEWRGAVVIPEEVAPALWQTLGIDMPTESARRLFSHLNTNELASALESAGSRTSGSKDSRLERLITERIQPREVLPTVSVSSLREICRLAEAPTGGNKDDLIERIIGHFAQGKDQPEEVEIEAPRREERELPRDNFEMLFGALLQQELTDILRCFPDLRQTGTKDMRIRTLWDAHLSERTLLSELMNRDLERVLDRLGLKPSGAKDERINRIIGHFAHGERLLDAEPPRAMEDLGHPNSSLLSVPDEVLQKQEQFRQRASSPQALLQPWLDELLEGQGLVRCYATEDPNPTKQLKNKLSQAAAATDGLMVLILADAESFDKAREALVARWMTNAEWPKSVAAVALAYPAPTLSIATIVQRCSSPWPARVKRNLFPGAEVVATVVKDKGNSLSEQASCAQCNGDLPSQARFCPNCGAPVAVTTPHLEA